MKVVDFWVTTGWRKQQFLGKLGNHLLH